MVSRILIVLAFILGISVPIQSQPEPNTTMVGCTTDRSCGENLVNSTIKDCCDHDIEPSGFAYFIYNDSTCQLCPVDFGFSQSSFSGSERGESYKVQVKFFSGGITTGFLYTLSLDLSGTASSSDVSLTTTRGRFLPSDVDEPKDVEFSLIVDNIAQEINETFAIVLQLSGTDPLGAGATIRDRLEVVIIDSDEIIFQLSEQDYTQNEEPNALMEVLITKRSGIQLANPVYFRVTPLTVGDAISRSVIDQFEDENIFSPNRANYKDFNQSVLYFEFPTVGDAVEVTIPIVDDDIDEADEQVFIIFLEVTDATNLNTLKFLENRNTSVGRIIDDEIIRIGFERKSYEVTEPDPDDDNLISKLVYLIRENNQKSEQTYSVDLTVGEPGGNLKPATLETSDINENFDYSLNTIIKGQTKINVLFPPAEDRVSFPFSLNSDKAVEGTESFRATSAQVTPSGLYPVFQTPITAFANTLIHILDNDVLKIGFEELNYAVNESAGTVEVCFTVINPPPTDDLDVTVTLTPSTINGTAGAGSDFTQLTASLSISLEIPSSVGSPTAGPRRKCFDVTITDDDLFENTESFSLLLQEDTFSSQTGAIISPNLTEIFIFDEDEVVIGFLSDRYSVSESDGTAFIEFGVITGSLGTDISVKLSLSDGSASSGSDYNSTEKVYSLTGRETVTVGIGIIEDDKFERAEVFYASLSFVVVPPRVTLQPDRTEINIIDAGALIFSFRVGAYSFMESIGTGTVYVDKIGFSTVNITLRVSGALPGGQTLNQLITFTPSDSEKFITFNIPDDNIALEPPETFTLTLTAVTIIDGIMLQPNDKTDITILDDDELIIGFAGDVSVSESENATLSITFSSVFATNFIIDVGPPLNDSLFLIEAEPDEDYYVPNFTVEAISTLHNASNSLYFDVSIIQDGFLEDEECFVTAISLPNSVSGVVEIAENKDTAIVCIQNDDRVTISFNRVMYSVGENDGIVQISASLVQGELQRPVEVLFSTQSGTATSEDPKDFLPLQRVPLQFDELMIQNKVSVNIINDNIFEGEEIFFASLVTNDAFVDFGENATITIVDDGVGVRFGFGPVQYTVNEGAGSVTLFVALLEGTLEREVNLQFSTVEGTATGSAPADYQPEARTITFSSSVSNVSITITIVDDSILESTENFLVNLADPQSQIGVSTMPNTANVDIVDNDGVTIGFERTTYSVDEGDVVEVYAVLTGTLEKSVQVFVSSSSGSATVNEDYNPVVEVLTFDQAISRTYFNVSTVEDQILEETTENLNLNLTTLDIDVTLLPDQAQVSIHDDDRVTFGLKDTSLTLNEEGGPTARVCVIVTTGILGRDVIITLNTMDGTATSIEPADFVALLNSITFSPGDREICQDISILEDTLYEDDESFSALLSTGDSSADIDPSHQSATITIMDTDVITIGFTRERDMVEEDVDNRIIICVEVKNNGTLEKSITVQLNTVDGTAKANEDYNSTSHSLEFTPDNERDQQCRAVNILSDDNSEGTETFMATLSTRDDRVFLVPDTETIFIVDDDVVNIVFIGAPFEGIEDSGFVAITVGVMDPDKLKTEVSVNLTTEDIVVSNAATAGVDYRPLDVTLTFSETVTVITVNVILFNDSDLEGDEDFRARLSTNSGSNVGVGPEAIISIIDDDRVIIGFEEETVQVDENVGMKTLCVNVSRGQLARTTTVSIAYQDQTAINGQEYSAQPMTFTFSKDDTGQCFNVDILDDDIDEPEKTFLVMLLTGDPQVTLSPDTATITIIDNDERRVAVNDTIIGDPLFTVPILVDRDQREMLNMTKPQLCYEIHGDANQWFNLVTDNCTTVNALYTPLNDRLNVITKIGVKAVDDDNKCVEILVDRSQCSVSVNGTVLGMESYSSGNIKVRRYSKRARISVPNCNDINLIMWVICEERTILNSDVTGEMLKFVVLRGLNYGRRAHGLLGQFWNVPVDITPYTDLLHDGTPATDRFNIKVKRDKGNDARSFTGLLYELSWDHVEEPCLYVGNKQAGPIHEVATPNDGVIENIFQNYIVSDAFSEEYEFSLFDLVKCSKVGSD